MSNFTKALEKIVYAAKKKEEGFDNCIPSPFVRYQNFFPGIEPAKYTLITANAKVGKTQITDFMYLYHPIWYTLTHATNYEIKVLYFSLEMSEDQKIIQAISHFLKRFYDISASPKTLRSLTEVLDKTIISKISEMKGFMEKFFEKVEYIDHIRNRYGIWKYIFDYAEKNGEIEYEEKNFDGRKVKVIKKYTPKNPNLITIVIVDHVSLLTPEGSDDKMKTISRFSGEDMVRARNLFGFNPVLVQQQASAQESLEHKKANALMPSLAGLADSKDTQRDVDIAFGLFSPARHEMNSFKGYDISKLGDNFRSLEILANREGSSNELCPLYFRGESSFFKELPLPKDVAINQYY